MSQKLVETIKEQFEELSGISCNAVFIEKGVNHKPSTLAKGNEKGVYVFILVDSCCFKVGKAGTDSQARWNSHHYNFDKTTPSTFTKSLLNDLPAFMAYFSETQKEELTNFHQILCREFGYDFKLKKSFLEKIDSQVFENVKTQIPIKDWIKNNISRMEFKISNDDALNYDLDLLEKFMAFKLRPIYEG